MEETDIIFNGISITISLDLSSIMFDTSLEWQIKIESKKKKKDKEERINREGKKRLGYFAKCPRDSLSMAPSLMRAEIISSKKEDS